MAEGVQSVFLFLSTPSARRATEALHSGCIDTKFLSTPSARRATTAAKQQQQEAKFLSTPSARRATTLPTLSTAWMEQFLSTPSARRATVPPRASFSSSFYFYPRPPRGGRPFQCSHRSRFGTFLSTPSARRATPRACSEPRRCRISIHALREEGDVLGGVSSLINADFYPRPPRGGRRTSSTVNVNQYLFLSTPSARRATLLLRS